MDVSRKIDIHATEVNITYRKGSGSPKYGHIAIASNVKLASKSN